LHLLSRWLTELHPRDGGEICFTADSVDVRDEDCQEQQPPDDNTHRRDRTRQLL
jgi:hypothetical protein